MKRIVLKGLNVSGDLISEHCPENPNFFSLYVTLHIGTENDAGESLFELHVCSVKWLEYALKYADNKCYWGLHSLIMEKFDVSFIEQAIVEKLAIISNTSNEGKNSLEEIFSRYASWEFEDFKSRI